MTKTINTIFFYVILILHLKHKKNYLYKIKKLLLLSEKCF